MRVLPLLRSLLPVVFLVPLAARAADESDSVSVRSIMVYEHPDGVTRPIYVKGGIVTTLRFEQPVDASKTKMIGWEGRLEPLAVVRNKVILEPIQELDKDEGIPLVVTLANGTQVPFLIRPFWSMSDRLLIRVVDQQVDVFEDRESYAAMQVSLMNALKKNGALTQENARYHTEETSADHALAALLASGAIAQTRFKPSNLFSGKDEDSDVRATVFRGKGKAGVVIKLKNLQESAWSVQQVRLSTSPGGNERAVAMRATSREILPGQSGVVAFVVDGSAFVDEGVLTDLILEVYRQDGQRQAFVTLDHRLIER